MLALLLEHPGALVTREELRQKLWPADTFVDFDTGLNTAIKKLRDVLGDSAEKPPYIETQPRHGYCFIAPVVAHPEGTPQIQDSAEPGTEVWATLWKPPTPQGLSDHRRSPPSFAQPEWLDMVRTWGSAALCDHALWEPFRSAVPGH